MGTTARRVAVVGCAHGELDKIYATLQYIERTENIKIDLVLCCGDFQAVRNELDLQVLACPPKYRSMNTFWKYYAGHEAAPWPTVFVGGNHEASNHLWELFYGGWAAPNMYYLGAAGVISFGGLRIGGLSGIYKGHEYRSGHFERQPYNESEKRSIYHVREYDVQKLMQIKEPVDIFLSHDWPRGIAYSGDMHRLLRHKPFLEQEIAANTLGSQPAYELLTKLKPSYWFSAHLHTVFPAVVGHPNGKVTKFLALDKCLPGRPFLQVLEIPTSSDGPLEIGYDREWLAITRAYNSHLPLERTPIFQPPPDLQPHRNWINSLETLPAPPPFELTVPPHDPSRMLAGEAVHMRSPQTLAFLNLLELPYLLDSGGPGALPAAAGDPNEIALDDSEDDKINNKDDNYVNNDNNNTSTSNNNKSNAAALNDPNEIPLDEEEEEL